MLGMRLDSFAVFMYICIYVCRCATARETRETRETQEEEEAADAGADWTQAGAGGREEKGKDKIGLYVVQYGSIWEKLFTEVSEISVSS